MNRTSFVKEKHNAMKRDENIFCLCGMLLDGDTALNVSESVENLMYETFGMSADEISELIRESACK